MLKSKCITEGVVKLERKLLNKVILLFSLCLLFNWEVAMAPPD